jgi:hypothetical protein
VVRPEGFLLVDEILAKGSEIDDLTTSIAVPPRLIFLFQSRFSWRLIPLAATYTFVMIFLRISDTSYGILAHVSLAMVRLGGFSSWLRS